MVAMSRADRTKPERPDLHLVGTDGDASDPLVESGADPTIAAGSSLPIQEARDLLAAEPAAEAPDKGNGTWAGPWDEESTDTASEG